MGICITNLSVSEHTFLNYHFCRGNNSKRKNRIGLIVAGEATFTYLNQTLKVKAGDILFVPERIFCYSEWHGAPHIDVFYLNFDWGDRNPTEGYALQILSSEDEESRKNLHRICDLLHGDEYRALEAYALFYRFLSRYLPQMNNTRQKLSRELCTAIDYITAHRETDFTVSDVAKVCAISESKLYHLFRAQLGQSPIAYLNALKVNYAIQYLEHSEYSIGEICRRLNFHSESYFRRVFQKTCGMTPSEYRKQVSKI